MVTMQQAQTGLRIERNTLKVLTGLAEYLDLSLGDLVDGIVLHAFEGKTPFGPPILTKIDQLKAVYGLTLTAADAHKLTDHPCPGRWQRGRGTGDDHARQMACRFVK